MKLITKNIRNSALIMLALGIAACSNDDGSSSISNAIDATKDAASNAVEATSDAASGAAEMAKDAASGAAEMAKDAGSAVSEGAADAVDAAGDALNGADELNSPDVIKGAKVEMDDVSAPEMADKDAVMDKAEDALSQ